MKPIRPEEVGNEPLDNDMIAIVNTMIRENYTNGQAILRQDEIATRYTELTGRSAYSSGRLNFEEVYRKAGWAVVYDKPAYCESYPATFTFKSYGVK